MVSVAGCAPIYYFWQWENVFEMQFFALVLVVVVVVVPIITLSGLMLRTNACLPACFVHVNVCVRSWAKGRVCVSFIIHEPWLISIGVHKYFDTDAYKNSPNKSISECSFSFPYLLKCMKLLRRYKYNNNNECYDGKVVVAISAITKFDRLKVKRWNRMRV